MADEQQATTKVTYSFLETTKHFPPIIEGKINTEQYLEAAENLTLIVDKISKIFTPVKYDIQGNIENIRKTYNKNKSSCPTLLELVHNERSEGGHMATGGLLWLNRALLFFELIFEQLIERIKAQALQESMNPIFVSAYERSVKPYHGWVTQQLFHFICKMCPTLPQILETFGADKDLKGFAEEFQKLITSLHLVRSKVDEYYKEHNINS